MSTNTPATPATLAARTSDEDRATLLRIATESIAHGLRHHQPLPVTSADFPPSLRADRATFVTLYAIASAGRQLRGCIGTLQACMPLVEDVAHNAFAAAFHDPRFPPVCSEELPAIDIQLSILSPPELMSFVDQNDLVGQIRPGVDGIIIEEKGVFGGRRGTLLPSVWENLSDPRRFIEHVKLKAGLPPDYWSASIKAYRYTAESVP
jgi:AmmeMemoRadiSam system protein A